MSLAICESSCIEKHLMMSIEQPLCGHKLNSTLQKRATGDVLLREVFKHVGLDEEKEYFGLSFQDNKGQVVREPAPFFQ